VLHNKQQNKNEKPIWYRDLKYIYHKGRISP